MNADKWTIIKKNFTDWLNTARTWRWVAIFNFVFAVWNGWHRADLIACTNAIIGTICLGVSVIVTCAIGAAANVIKAMSTTE